MNRLLLVAAAMVAVAGVGGIATIGTAMASKRPQGLDACTSAAARAGLRDAILTRIAAKGGDVDAGYALSLDTPRLESVDYVADRTICGGTARWAVPEHRRAALDGVSELSDPVRFMIEPGRDGGRMVVALVGGGDRIANWLGAPPPPPAAPPPEMLKADYVEPEAGPTLDLVPVDVAGSETVTPGLRAVVERMAAGLVASQREGEPPSDRVERRPPGERRAEPARLPPPPPTRAATTVSQPPSHGRTAERPRPASRGPSAQTRQLNAGVSGTTRLNAQPPRLTQPIASPASPDPTPVSTSRVEAPPPPPSGGPSFDCRRSRNAAERAICGDDRLARMDVAMSRRYAEAQSGLNSREAADLRAEQLEWLRRRDDCQTLRCLETMYQTRAARLDRMY